MKDTLGTRALKALGNSGTRRARGHSGNRWALRHSGTQGTLDNRGTSFSRLKLDNLSFKTVTQSLNKLSKLNLGFSQHQATISFIIVCDFSMFYQTFFSTQGKRWAITYKHSIYELPHEFPDDVRLRILEKQEISSLPTLRENS